LYFYDGTESIAHIGLKTTTCIAVSQVNEFRTRN